MTWYERAEEQIEKEYDEGGMSHSELNEAMRDLHEEYEQSRQDAAQEAYDSY